MKKNIILCFLVGVLFSFNHAYSIETKANYAYLVDYETNVVMFDKNSNIPTTPSSMSKLMTIYITLDRIVKKQLSLEDKFFVSEKAWRKKGSKMFLHVNEKVTVYDLLMGAIVQSGNDACIALAEGIAGSEDLFVEQMNKKAKELGLNESYFVNSTGWPEPKHLMSAKDLAILAKRIISDFPQYYHYFAIKEFTYNNIKQKNRNGVLYKNIGVDGLKTGHTDIAAYGITASAKKGDRRLILVLNGLESDKERTTEAERLLQYGFLNYTNILVAKKTQIVAKAKVYLGKSKEVELKPNQDIIITVPVEFTDKVRTKIINNDKPLSAPVYSNFKAADLVVEVPNQEPKIFPLYTSKEIKKLPYLSRIIFKIYSFIFGKE